LKAALFAACVEYPGCCQPTWFARSESGAVFLSYEAEDAALHDAAFWPRWARRWLAMPVHDGPDAGRIVQDLCAEGFELVPEAAVLG